MYSSNEFYTMAIITKHILYIQWHRISQPGHPIETKFLDELEDFLLTCDNNTIVLLSDLNRGFLAGRKALKRLSALAAHSSVATTAAFSKNCIAGLFFDTYRLCSQRRLQHRPEANMAFRNLTAALMYIQDVDSAFTAELTTDSPNEHVEALLMRARQQALEATQ